jgi:hypothetical protein
MYSLSYGLEQIALINTRLDAQTADTIVAGGVVDTPVAQRRRDAQRDGQRDDPNSDKLALHQVTREKSVCKALGATLALPTTT